VEARSWIGVGNHERSLSELQSARRSQRFVSTVRGMPWLARVTAFATITLFALPGRVLSPARASESETTIPASATTPALPAHLARPAIGGIAPAIVVLHGCEGYRKRYGAIADDFAKAGYVAVAIDTLTPRGVKNACSDRKGSRIEAADARATLAWLRSQPYVDPNRLGVVGYSMGAIAALDLAVPQRAREAPPGLKAAVAYYPACVKRSATNVVVPLRILDGDADDWTPAPPCAALASDAEAAGAPVDITTYPNATHAFNVDLPNREALGHPLRYDPAATKDAEAKTLQFFRTHLGDFRS
jgi:dienelactone hydrolase